MTVRAPFFLVGGAAGGVSNAAGETVRTPTDLAPEEGVIPTARLVQALSLSARPLGGQPGHRPVLRWAPRAGPSLA